MSFFAELIMEEWIAEEIERANPPLTHDEIEVLRETALDMYAVGVFRDLRDFRE